MDTSKASDNANIVLNGVKVPATDLTATDYLLIIKQTLERYGRLIKHFPCVTDHEKALVGITDYAGGTCDSPGSKPEKGVEYFGVNPSARLLPLATLTPSNHPRRASREFVWEDKEGKEEFLFLTDSLSWVYLARKGIITNPWRDHIVFSTKELYFQSFNNDEIRSFIGNNHVIWLRILTSLQRLADKAISERRERLQNMERAYSDVNTVLCRIERDA